MGAPAERSFEYCKLLDLCNLAINYCCYHQYTGVNLPKMHYGVLEFLELVQ